MIPGSIVAHSLVQTALRGLCLIALLVGAFRTLWLLVREPCTALAQAWVADGASGIGALSFPHLLAGLCAGAVLLCSTWLAATTGVVTLLTLSQVALRVHATTNGHEYTHLVRALGSTYALTARLCPPLAHQLILAGCGVALGTGLVSSTAHANSWADSWADSRADSWGEVAGLAVPDRAVDTLNRAHSAKAEVTRGDSLWSISADHLPTATTNRGIAVAWQQLYRTNLALIGPDPDLILPGTMLRVPPLNDERKDLS